MNESIKYGDRVMCVTFPGQPRGFVIKQYYPTACSQQTQIICDDGRVFHAPTSDFVKIERRMKMAKRIGAISGAGFEENSPLADCNEKFDQSGSYSEAYSDIADEISKTIGQVSMRVTETQDEFIFQTLRDFALDSFNITVEKEELVQAIQLIRMMKEYGINIHERYGTATTQAGIFRRGYEKGLHDGIEKERSRVMDIMEKGERDEINSRHFTSKH